MAVTSLLLGEGLPKVVGLPEQEDPNNPAEPEIQAIYNRTAIQARRAPAPGPWLTFHANTQHAADSCGWLVSACQALVISPFRLSVGPRGAGSCWWTDCG